MALNAGVFCDWCAGCGSVEAGLGGAGRPGRHGRRGSGASQNRRPCAGCPPGRCRSALGLCSFQTHRTEPRPWPRACASCPGPLEERRGRLQICAPLGDRQQRCLSCARGSALHPVLSKTTAVAHAGGRGRPQIEGGGPLVPINCTRSALHKGTCLRPPGLCGEGEASPDPAPPRPASEPGPALAFCVDPGTNDAARPCCAAGRCGPTKCGQLTAKPHCTGKGRKWCVASPCSSSVALRDAVLKHRSPRWRRPASRPCASERRRAAAAVAAAAARLPRHAAPPAWLQAKVLV